MGCCILAAILFSPFLLCYRRLRGLLRPGSGAQAAGTDASAWRLAGSAADAGPEQPARAAAGGAPARRWRLHAAVALLAATLGYLLASHADHLRMLVGVRTTGPSAGAAASLCTRDTALGQVPVMRAGYGRAAARGAGGRRA